MTPPRCALDRISGLADLPGVGARQWLSASEQARIEGFGSEPRRRSSLAGRWLARLLLAPLLQRRPEDIPLQLDAEGRSSVTGHPGLHLSFSHSGDWVACAVADVPIGIDIERMRPRGDLLGLAATVCSTAQCEELAALSGEARLRRFYQLWTLKEAWLKCRGRGLDFARMRELDYIPATASDAAQAFSYEDAASGWVLAVDVDGRDAPVLRQGHFPAPRRLRYSVGAGT